MAKEHGENREGVELGMIDESKLFEKIETKQFEIDYDNSVTKSIQEYSKAEGKIEALEWVKRLIAEECDNDFMIDNTIKLGKEWD